MNIFLDSNVVVAILNREYPLFDYAAKVLSLSDRNDVEIYVSPVTVATAYYFATKKSGEAMAKKKIELFLNHVRVSSVDHDCVQKAVSDPKVLDVEDGIQYYSALMEKCSYIVSENVKDFHFSKLPVMRADEFLEEFGRRGKQ